MKKFLTIPERYQIGISKLWALSDKEVDDIVKALAQTALLSSRSETVSKIASVVPSSAQDTTKALETLVTLYRIRADADVPIATFAEDLSRAFSDNIDKLTPEQEARFKAKFEKLLGVDSTSVNSKALSLKADHENSFCDSKILTDVRPVFGIRVEDHPVGFVVTHTLKIVYHDDSGKHREFFVSMDDDDLADLKTTLDRAERKRKSLDSLMEQTGIKRLDSGKGGEI